MPPDLTFEQWVILRADAIAEARGVSVEDVATEPAELAKQLARARQHLVIVGELKADATSWVNKTRALAVQEARRKYPDYPVDERRVMADADPLYVAALKVRDDVAATAAALKAMHFEILNDRRTSFNPAAHNDD